MRSMPWRAVIVGIAAVSGPIPLLFITNSASADTGTPATTTSSPPTLTVTGDGTAEVTPDLASLQVTVTRSALTSRVALSEANARTDAIVRAIKRAGVPATGIQTSQIDTSNTSHPVGPKGHRHLLHQFTTNESLSITMAAGLAGAVIDAATHSGATSVTDLNFSFSNPDAGLAQANDAAIASANQQANSAAAAINDVITGVQSIDLNPESNDTQASSGSTLAAAPSKGVSTTPTNVNPGQQQVSATVQIVYTMAPASS